MDIPKIYQVCVTTSLASLLWTTLLQRTEAIQVSVMDVMVVKLLSTKFNHIIWCCKRATISIVVLRLSTIVVLPFYTLEAPEKPLDEISLSFED